MDWDYYDWYYRPFDEILDAYANFQARFPSLDGLWPSFNRGMDNGKILVRKDGRRLVVDMNTGREWVVPDWEPRWGGADFKDVTLPDKPDEPVLPTLDDIRKERAQLGDGNPLEPELRTSRVRQKIGPGVFLVEVGGMPFPHTIFRLGGMERAFYVFADNPDLFLETLDFYTERLLRRIPKIARAGANAISMNAYYEGADIFSPAQWKEICYPYYCRIAEECRKVGLFSLVWFLGDCLPLCKWLADAGIDCLYVEQPRRGYSSDPGKFRKMVGNRITLTGWTGELETIRNDHPAIEKRLKEQFEAAGRDGAFIFGTTYLTNETRPEAIDFFCKKGMEIGKSG